MALNKNRVEKRNKADELIEIEEKQKEEAGSNSSIEIIKSLNREALGEQSDSKLPESAREISVYEPKPAKPKGKVGRPRRYKNISEQKTIHLATYLPEDYADKLKQLAEESNTTVSEYIAAILMKKLREDQ